ncbi:ArnT family glycosyltransferase [Fimbriiglobus ruber]|uniref:Glycosyltransferase RgtA/B/C/D-like domain-containing protein n=1 Tax=Fimbriiglobus ruber TaxID=1908690 RepID=A0A225DBP3_9BACT|nr:glycosyltransferase family 39 protein [Fimbriiglobus ruber]OWK34716.1 hypothetical protein FRUB_09558 [Fimbriiglobus ruber]
MAPADDELYYWCWAEHLQLSYYDHPPMTAYLIRASTEVFGDTLFAVRFPALVASLFVLAVIGWLSRPRHLLAWVVFTPLYTFGGVINTPDTPLLLFWAAYLAWLVVAHQRLSGPPSETTGTVNADDETAPKTRAGSIPFWLWTIGGVILGCGMLSKYTTGLLVPAGFLTFLLSGKSWRTWVPGYIYHGVVSSVVFTPVILFNWKYDFAPIRYQWGHAMATDDSGFQPFGEFVGVQLLLFGTLPFILFPWVLWNFRRLAADPRLRVCACLYAAPFGFFLYKALRGPLEGNWALACYIAFWPLAAHWYEGVRGSIRWRVFSYATFMIPATCVVLVIVHLIHPVGLLPSANDRITRQFVINDVMREAAEAVKARGDGLPVYTVSYQTTSFLRFYGADARQIEGVTRPSHFTMTPEHLTDVDRAYVFFEGPLPEEFASGFDPPQIIKNFPIVVRGDLYSYYQLLLYTRHKPQVAKPETTGCAVVADRP